MIEDLLIAGVTVPLPLVTKRLLIRPFELDDAEAFHEVLGDERVMGRIPSGPSATVDVTRDRIQRIIEFYKKWGFGMWALIERSSKELIGNCGLIPVEGVGPEVELAYDIAYKHWNKGYATESSIACLEYGFKTVKLDRIIAITFPDHFASMRVMEKAGLERIGRGFYYNLEMVKYALTREKFLQRAREIS